MQPLTDDGRKTLCAELRRLPGYFFTTGIKAAEEIERLAALSDGILAAMRTIQKQYEEMGDRAQKAEREIERLERNSKGGRNGPGCKHDAAAN